MKFVPFISYLARLNQRLPRRNSNVVSAQLFYDWSTTILWLIYYYKLQTYDSGMASIFRMPTKIAREDILLAIANQVFVEDNLLVSTT
jgi:hypothetical protein